MIVILTIYYKFAPETKPDVFIIDHLGPNFFY